MAIELISKIKPKNNGNFKLVDASDVETTEGTSVQQALESLNQHTNSTDIHVTTTDKTKWNGGADTASRVEGGLSTHTGNSDIHVTASEKQNWNGFLTSSGNYVQKGDIVNNLTSTDAYKPLSAAQGKALADQIANAGGGDMLKSTYDPDNDGKVEKAKYADTAGTATNATTATNANNLGNVASSSYATKTYVTTVLGDYAKKTDLQNLGGGDMLASVYADASKTGYVKNATNADAAANAATADWAEEAAYADEAASADDAAKLGGKAPSHYAANSELTTLAGSVVGDQTWTDYYANTKSIGEVIGSWNHDRLKDTTIAEQCCILRDMLQTTGLYITFSINNWKTGAPKNTTWETFVSCDTEARYALDLGKNGTTIVNGDGESLYLNSTLVKTSDIIQSGKNYIFK